MLQCTVFEPDNHAAGSGNIAAGQQSDHLLMAAAYNGWAAAKAKVSICVHLSVFMCKLVAHPGTLLCMTLVINKEAKTALSCQAPCMHCTTYIL